MSGARRAQGGMFEIPGQPNMINIQDMLGKAIGGKAVKRKVKVKDSHALLMADEADKLLDQDQLTREAVELVENHGIVFIDEIDKVASGGRGYSGPSREGVQRDLLPLIEGTTVSTKYGPVKTDHILFIASGAFHVSKPSDLLPELQGRLPIRVELQALSKDDLVGILKDTDASLIKQYVALMATEGLTLDVHDGRHRGDCRCGGEGQFDGREHRRPPPADDHGAAGRRHLVRGAGEEGRDHHDRPRLCRRPHRQDGGRRGPQPLRAVGRINV